MDNTGKLGSGDILIFKAGDNWVSKAIAWLTDSDVSHAAMMLDGKTMVEMGSGGISASNVEVLDGDDVILLRLSPEKDPAPLVNAARRYMDSKTRYDFPALAFLAGLIIYRKVRPTQKFVNITDAILRAACVALDKLIQAVILKNPDKAMVCSQLVYQVYSDCGRDYRIKIDGGQLQAAGGPDAEDGCICLADLASDAPVPEMTLMADGSTPDVEELAEELYIALTEQGAENGLELATADLAALPSWAKSFLEKLEEFLEKSKSDLPIDALFITPADLAYKSTNLAASGKLDVKRVK